MLDTACLRTKGKEPYNPDTRSQCLLALLYIIEHVYYACGAGTYLAPVDEKPYAADSLVHGLACSGAGTQR